MRSCRALFLVCNHSAATLLQFRLPPCPAHSASASTFVIAETHGHAASPCRCLQLQRAAALYSYRATPSPSRRRLAFGQLRRRFFMPRSATPTKSNHKSVAAVPRATASSDYSVSMPLPAARYCRLTGTTPPPVSPLSATDIAAPCHHRHSHSAQPHGTYTYHAAPRIAATLTSSASPCRYRLLYILPFYRHIFRCRPLRSIPSATDTAAPCCHLHSHSAQPHAAFVLCHAAQRRFRGPYAMAKPHTDNANMLFYSMQTQRLL